MSFEAPVTIKEVVDDIHKRKYFLPAIQRELVWDAEQIERLFDSIMRDYPIGSFLFWHVDKDNKKRYQFYEFIREYHERDKRHNPKADTSGGGDITAILDGQQRLTALYIGLKGKYACKLPRKRWSDDSSFPDRMLYLNLLQRSDELDMEYMFRLLTREEAEHSESGGFWFRVGDILDIEKEYQVNNYLLRHRLLSLDEETGQFANETMFKLHSAIHKDRIINYYLEKDKRLDKVLNIFIRVNSSGTPLSYSDLLLSIATAQWEERDAREEITSFVDEISNIGDGFGFNKDFVLKACLVLSDFKDIAFKVDNFDKTNMLKIERNWGDITEAIRLAVTLVYSFGYSRETLAANNAVIPISYYLLKKGNPYGFITSSEYASDRRAIGKWLILSLLRRTFGGQPDTVLRPTRDILAKNHSSFPLDAIAERFKGTNKSLTLTDDEIDNLLYLRYGQSYTFATLALLYPSLDFRNKFHIDHIFPKSFFTRKKLAARGIGEAEIGSYLEYYNCLGNLQLLEGLPNQEKADMDFGEWIGQSYPDKSDRRDYMRKHYIPDVDLDLGNFLTFLEEREKLITDKLKSLRI